MAEIAEELAPTGEDERAGDTEYNPAMEPEKAKAWLNLLRESEKAFEEWNECCDNIEKLYANLEFLRCLTRDRQFNLFWANLEILKPSIYAKPPVPVVVPKFKDRRPLYQTTSELLERCSIVAFDLTRINDLLMLVRDDLATTGRGVAWCRYEPADEEHEKPEYVCVDHKGQKRFPALAVTQLARGDVGGGGQLPDAGAGQGAVRQVLRRRIPEGRIQGR